MVSIFALLLACTGLGLPTPSGDSGDSGAAADADTDTDTDADADADCVGTGFGAISQWALPSGYPEGTFDSLTDTDPSDGINWAVFDVGKGGPDIVITTSATDADVGTTKWILHSNTGSRFRDGPLEWMLPSDFEPGTFTNFYDSSTTDKVVWAMVDLDGDGSLDIVVTDTDSGSGGIGSTRWLLYTNTGDGFSPTSTNWSLPSGFNDGALDTIYDSDTSDGANWALLDMDGDGKSDLVVSDTDADTSTIGSSKWIYYRNNGAGFDGAAEWTLPPSFEPETFVRFYDSSSTDTVVWGLMDFTGDKRPDIIVVDTDTGNGGIGSTRWLLYTNTGSGFSANTNWTLPTGFNDSALDTVGDGASDDGVTWSLTDLNGDGVPDIVVTDSDAETTTGNASWSVYAGGAGGFAGTSSAWSLPTGLGTNLFTSLYDAAPEDGVSFGLANLGEDNVSDLVFVKNAADAEVGRTYWQQARANCQ